MEITNPKPFAEGVMIIADSERVNGTKATNKGIKVIAGIAVGGMLLWLMYKGIDLGFFKKREAFKQEKKAQSDILKNQLKRSENQEKHEQAMAKENLKHAHKMAEEQQRQTNRKELHELRQITKSGCLLSGDNDVDLTVPTFDEIMKGDDIDVSELRIGQRWIHINENCGLIGANGIGKSSFVMQYVLAVCGNKDMQNAFPNWHLKVEMQVLYFAFEHGRQHFKTKYKNIKNIDNLYLDVNTAATDYKAIRGKIEHMQANIGNKRLLVVFDNITKMKDAGEKSSSLRRDFFAWLEDFRKQCNEDNKPITYLKIYHAEGSHTNDKPFHVNCIYGSKKDAMFTQDLVAFGMCKGDGKTRYLKELKNKLEPDAAKETVSVFSFANTPEEIEAGEGAPLYEYAGEAMEKDILPSSCKNGNTFQEEVTMQQEQKRGPGRGSIYTISLLQEIAEYRKMGFEWKEIMDFYGIEYNPKNPMNKARGIKEAMKTHKIEYK